jgi:cysteine synthase
LAKFDSILETIGRTPVVRLARIGPPHVRIYVKLEARNPLGSVKDRLALGIIEDAERSGALRPGQTVIEATSGNTGIGLAMVCARKGYPLVIVMAESFSVERRKLMRFLGAKVVLTSAAKKGTGMLQKAEELAREHGWFLCRQFENEANAEVHSTTTAQEILEDFDGERLDAFVTGAGTGGTLKGVARVLRAERPETRIILCEPENSPMMGSGIAQPRDEAGRRSVSHPRFRPHPVQGWAPDFIPQLTEDALTARLVDQIVPIAGADAITLARRLAREEGIFCGISGGATLAAALEVARTAAEGAAILCMLPDTGERYLSTPLFDGIGAEMDAEERRIEQSVTITTAPPVDPSTPDLAGGPPLDDDASAFVREVLSDPGQPVVMFAFEWCEFCWAVRKFFRHLGVGYRSVDLDAVELQAGDRGGKIRAALTARTRVQTIPQVFVGERLVGGAVDVLAAWERGELQPLLAEHGVGFDGALGIAPRSFLPGWLQA